MTPRKKWPHHAEWARMDCIALASRIAEHTVKAQEALLDGNRLLAAAILADIRGWAKDIQLKLVQAKEGGHHGG